MDPRRDSRCLISRGSSLLKILKSPESHVVLGEVGVGPVPRAPVAGDALDTVAGVVVVDNRGTVDVRRVLAGGGGEVAGPLPTAGAAWALWGPDDTAAPKPRAAPC